MMSHFLYTNFFFVLYSSLFFSLIEKQVDRLIEEIAGVDAAVVKV
jgi:hypothetical protein